MSKPAWANSARTGPVRPFKELVVFACEGLLAVVDERPGKSEGEYTVVTPSDMEERVRALNRTYRGITRSQLDTRGREQYDKQTSGSQNLMECIKEARAMGDPSDPAVQAWWSRHRRSSTVKINFSPGCDPAGYPTLPKVDLGKRTGRTAAIDGEAAVPSNTAKRDKFHIHQQPKRKPRSSKDVIILDD